MTSISLLRSRLQTAERIREFARLNLTWALGASFAPAILLRVAARSGVAVVLDGLAILFASFVLFTVVCISSTMPPRTGTQARWFRGVGAVPMIVLLLIPLTTGTESGIGNWLSLYILRSSHVLSITIRTTTAFGFGILMSRLVYSRNTHPERLQNLVLRLHPALIVVGLVLLITVQSAAVSTGAALLTGFGVGPLYPLALAILLNHDEAGNLGFVAGGFGASVLPLITGAVSSWTHSLRTGLLVLLVSALLMAVLASRVPVGSPTSPREQ